MSKREKILGFLTVLVVLGAGILTVISPPPGADAPLPPSSPMAKISAAAQLPAELTGTVRLASPAPPPAPAPQPAKPAPGAVDLKLLREYLLEPPGRELAVAEADIPDPFKPVIASAAEFGATTSAAATRTATNPSASLPMLEGVFIAGTDRMAVVDGRTVQAGDRLRDLVVGEVRADGIVCRKGSRSFLLTFTGLTPLW